MTVIERLQLIIRDALDSPDIVIDASTTQSSLEDWDSMATVQIVLATEAEFGIRMTTDEVAGMTSVRALLDAITRHSS